MRRAGLLYMLAGGLGIAAFFLPGADGWSLLDVVRGVGTARERLAVLDFLPLNVVLRLVQLAIVLIVLVSIYVGLFGLGLVRLGVDNPERPHVTVAAWCGVGIPVAMTFMSWPDYPGIVGVSYFVAGIIAVGAGVLAERNAAA